jgi:outer membrane protein OmpA-like peptidoglycan-associated protein
VPDVYVIGHTDTVGELRGNDQLSAHRAETVKGFLVGIGIPAERIQTAGRGKREPIVPTADNVDEPKNRRVEINVR